MGLGLLAFLPLQYASALRAPFMADDFLFLGRVRDASLATLLEPNTLVSHYYRPWSRELHVWALQAMFGPSEVAFHVANLVLALAALGLFAALATRVAGRSAAVLATAGAALLAAWGPTLLWAACAQDLWMIALGVAFLGCAVRGWRPLACALLALALLSKEPAGMLPFVAFSYPLIVERRTVGEAARDAWPYALVVLAWAALHPMLGGHAFRLAAAADRAASQSPVANLLSGLLSVVDLDAWPRPAVPLARLLVEAWPGVLILPLASWLALRARGDARAERAAARVGPAPVRVAAWGATWCGLGLVPTLQPGLLWQPYYALFAALGAWLVLGALARAHARLALVALAGLALLRTARAETPQSLMGSQWRQERTAELTRRMRDDLERLHPTLPAHARVYFGDVPWGLGLAAGDPRSPALRVWYGDTTLTGGFYSSYRPRGAGEPRGRDYFFLFEPDGHLAEVVEGAEPLAPGRPPSERWENDHYQLAVRLFDSGDVGASLGEWRKLAAVFPARYEYAWDLARCYAAAGAPDSAARWAARSEALRRGAASGPAAR